jgi:signal transduction histidine kinase
MLSDLTPTSGRQRDWAGVVIALVLVPAFCFIPKAGFPGLVVATTAAVAVAAALLRWRSDRVPIAAAAAVAAGLSLLVDIGYRGQAVPVAVWALVELPALVALIGLVIRRAPVRQAAAVGALLSVAVLALPLRFTLRGGGNPWAAWILVAMPLSLVVGCAIGVGLYLRSLDQRRVQAVMQARRSQRVEVARDLHDFVAHEITGIVLEAQGAQVGAYDEAQARELFARIEEAGLRALGSMDQTVQALQDPEERSPHEPPSTRVHGIEDLSEVLNRFAATGQIRAELDLESGLIGLLPREVDATAYRVVVEALTNIRRHARAATRVDVVARRVDDATVVVSVTNDGSGRHAGDDRHSGTGLIGLTERVQALGGTLTAGPYGDGWQVRVALPLPDAPTLRLGSG